jgi:hypothetical protein
VADDDFEAAGREYLADLAAVADAADCGQDRAASIIARLASDRNGVRLIITAAKWTALDAEVERLRAIFAKMFETGPADRPWAEVWEDSLSLDEQEHGEGVRFDLTADQAALLRQIRDGA